MRHAHTVEQVRGAEAELVQTLPQGEPMQRAAYGLAVAVCDLLGSTYGRRVVLLVGSGDNGGDALWAGAMLVRRGVGVEAWLLSEQVHETGLAALRAAGGRVVGASELQSALSGTRPDSDERLTSTADLVIDGIVGIGGRPGLSADAQAALDALADVPIVAVDVPSGVEVDSGRIGGAHVCADLTVTFGTYKIAHLVDPGAAAAGVVHLVDIGLDLPPAAVRALQPQDVRRLIPLPGPVAHKYTRGVLGIRAGSAQYPGAALLSVSGALTGLVGMVRYVGPDAVADQVRTRHPEVVGAGRVQAWVVGSGGGDGAGQELQAALGDRVPIIVDADALAHLEGPPGVPAVLTPHAGELSAMLGVARQDVEASPLEHARGAAQRYGCTVLLKGPHTLVADPDGRVTVTRTGTPWLATAGAGDVLGGLIGALLAAGSSPHDAAAVGSWLHGAAATAALREGPIVASDLAPGIRQVAAALI